MYIPQIRKDMYGKIAELIVEDGASKATAFLSDHLTIKATRRLYQGEIDGRSKHIEILFSIGVPNYQEREFIKKAKKAGEPFPIKKVLLEFPKEGK